MADEQNMGRKSNMRKRKGIFTVPNNQEEEGSGKLYPSLEKLNENKSSQPPASPKQKSSSLDLEKENLSSSDIETTQTSDEIDEDKVKQLQEVLETYKETSFISWRVLMFGILAVILVGILAFKQKSVKPDVLPRRCSTLLDLSKQFPKQDAFFWRSIKVSVDSVLRDEPPQPSVIVFVYKQNSAKAHQLISRISSTITSCFESNPQPLILTGKDFDRADMIKDYGVAISEYRDALKSSIVMFVHNVQEIPAQVVEAFHTICDKQTPMVDRSIILFSLESQDADPTQRSDLYELVEEKLTEQWKNSVPMNKIQPLLARMTETVLFLETK